MGREQKVNFWDIGDHGVMVTWYAKVNHLALKMCALYNCQSKIKISKNEFWKERKEFRSEGKPHSWDEHTDSSVSQLYPALCDPTDCSTPGLPVHHQLSRSCSNSMPSSHCILCCLLLLLPSVFPSIKIFSSESVLWIRWPRYWSSSFSISPSNEYSGLISLRID